MVKRFALAGSHRAPEERAWVIGAPASSDVLDVTVLLQRRTPIAQPSPNGAEPIARHVFQRDHGADRASLLRMDAFAQSFDLSVTAADPARRSVSLSGTVAAMTEAFGTTLKQYQSEHGVYRGRTGALFLPEDLKDVVVGVFGLDNRPQARPRSRRKRHELSDTFGREPSRDHSYTPAEIARLYGFPLTTGEGQTIAIIELGGGYKTSDLRAYFETLALPMPAVTAVSVGGARNAPSGDPNSADGEVLLDIEVVGAIASAARIVVYFAPNTDKGFLDAITTALHDETRAPSVVSISWGGPESSWTRQALNAYDEAFQDAVALGVSICCAAGDNGSGDGVADRRAHVDFPASSPHVLACGGTRLEASSGIIEREVVWDEARGGATGGGVSEVFPKPAYQQAVGVPPSVNGSHFTGRGVPDVAGNADPSTGYEIRVDGHDAVFGGTSAVAPLWAALIALRNEAAGTPLGYANPVLYAAAASKAAFRDVKSGANGAYRAGAGWDPCTGLGSPNGIAVFGTQPTQQGVT
jgi:kumamolisin